MIIINIHNVYQELSYRMNFRYLISIYKIDLHTPYIPLDIQYAGE